MRVAVFGSPDWHYQYITFSQTGKTFCGILFVRGLFPKGHPLPTRQNECHECFPNSPNRYTL